MEEKHRKRNALLLMALWLAAVLLMSWQFAAARSSQCDFVSVNGDFQSYNVFRRMLAGQTPFVDFQNYIGMAPAVVNLPGVALADSFAGSLFVTTFTSNLIFCAAVAAVFYLITGRLSVSLAASALLPKLVTAQLLPVLLGQRLGGQLTARLTGLFTPSNSMRGTRSFLPVLLVGLAVLAGFLWKRTTGKQLCWLQFLAGEKGAAAAGLATGFFITWSNDYGFAAPAAAFVLLVILNLAAGCGAKRLFARLGVFLLCWAGAGFLGICLVTGGHPAAFVQSAAETASYQYFYFNGTMGKSVLGYLFTCGPFWAGAALYLGFFGWALYRLLTKKADDRLLALVFIGLTVLAATFIYLLGGSGYNCREPLEGLAFLALCGFGAKLVLQLLHRWQKPVNLLFCCLLLGLTGYYGLQAATFAPAFAGVYSEGLGGYTTQPLAVVEAPQRIGDAPVFSTYATALETVTGQFQPTGTDYIIHALGEKAQADYAENFVQGQYPFAHTSALGVENWVANQNWYFYRHLLAGYEQIFKTEYGWLWQKTRDQSLPVQADCRVQVLNEGAAKLVCTSADSGSFVLDVEISYETGFSGAVPAVLSLGRTAVIASTGCCRNQPAVGIALPGKSKAAYIPVKMENGRGEAVLTGAYGDGITLTVHSARVVNALPLLDYETGGIAP